MEQLIDLPLQIYCNAQLNAQRLYTQIAWLSPPRVTRRPESHLKSLINA